MRDPELKNCPFCGSSAVEFVVDEDATFSYGGNVECKDCGVEGPICYSDEGADTTEGLLEINKALAARHWNRRVK